MNPSSVPAAMTTGEIIACLFGVPARDDEFEAEDVIDPPGDPDNYSYLTDVHGGDYGGKHPTREARQRNRRAMIGRTSREKEL